MPRFARKIIHSSSKRPASRPYKRKRPLNPKEIEQETSFASTSAEKLAGVDWDAITIDPAQSYVIIHFLSVFSFLSATLQCKECKSDIKFKRTAERGFGFKLVIECECRDSRRIESCPLINQSYEINRRIVFIIRLLGVGLQGINLFCSLMDISQGFCNSTYYALLNNIHVAAKAIFEVVQSKACQEEVEKNTAMGNEPLHLSISGDGSWKKRGFSSLFGVTSLIGKYTNKLLDLVVKSSFCQSCANMSAKKGTPEYDEWIIAHEPHCTANHSGSAGRMEVDAMKEMFLRSEELLGVKYANYIGDGDTKTFKGILDMDPYDDITVKKLECVGHVQKRMGFRLRSAKKANKGVGGKGSGKLTDKLIKELTVYYGLAIRRHSDSMENMKKAIWATLFHKISTDENPQHQNCPEGAESWCKWQHAVVTEQLEHYKHDPPLNPAVQKVIRPIYEDLLNDDLLRRCLGGNIQNNNESFNACIWILTPKHVHSGAKIIELAAYLAAAVFNEGYSSILKIMNVLGIVVGLQSKNFAENRDRRRIRAANVRVSISSKEGRMAKQLKEQQQQEFFEEPEGLLYGQGIAD